MTWKLLDDNSKEFFHCNFVTHWKKKKITTVLSEIEFFLIIFTAVLSQIEKIVFHHSFVTIEQKQIFS